MTVMAMCLKLQARHRGMNIHDSGCQKDAFAVFIAALDSSATNFKPDVSRSQIKI